MGSRLSLQVDGASRAEALTAWRAASGEMAAAEAVLSRFLRDSALSRLNAEAGSGRQRAVDRRLRRMLALAHRAQRQTDGRFDPRTLGALEAMGERAGVPHPATGDLAFGDASWLRRAGRNRVSVDVPIDSGGLGKGLGLRWALAQVAGAVPAVGGVLLDAGGDVVASGRPLDAEAWQVGIEDPGWSQGPLAVVALRDGALATSSTAVRAWTSPAGDRVHHLIDPGTWRPANGGLQAVTVAHRDPAWAEIWSKALFIGGARRIGPEARARGMAAWWVEDDGSLHLTPAAAEMTTWRR
jgi:thiamine biosynthesis lipoprotein